MNLTVVVPEHVGDVGNLCFCFSHVFNPWYVGEQEFHSSMSPASKLPGVGPDVSF